MPQLSFLVCSNRALGTLPRALNAIANQSHANLWECVLVDNGFTKEEASQVQRQAVELFQSGKFRMIREEQPGLGYARRTGIAAASGDWIIMLDDDNYLEPDFVAVLLKLLERFPEACGVSPCVYPLLPPPNAGWQKVVANRCLSVTEAALAALSGLPRLYAGSEAPLAPRPPGGGMTIRRSIALQWSHVSSDRGTLFLERTGVNLIGAGDEEIWRTLLSMGVPVLVANNLRIAHDLPVSRFSWMYLWRLNYWMAWSYARLDAAYGVYGMESGWLQSVRHAKLLLVAAGKEERLKRWMDWAAALGHRAGLRLTEQIKARSSLSGRGEVVPEH
jgi:glycosyltransferase involved in cell wall biosynthesis